MKKNRLIFLTGTILTVLFFIGCSTQKNTFISRNYHSITTKYNGYFNGRESYKEGIVQLEKLHVDNYEEVLKVFKYGTAQNAQSAAPKFDVAYKKASIVIQKHSMLIKNEEYNRWIDDCYYLIGRSQFYKREYNLSILTFEYIIRTYKSQLAYDSKVWIAKNYNELGLYDQAKTMLESAEKDVLAGNTSDEATRLFYLAYADHFLQQENYQAAIPHLNTAIQKNNKKRIKERLYFILAQSYQKTGNSNKAIETYTSLIKSNPSFDMAFQAKINLAMSYDQSAGDSKFIKNELNKMLRDSKNKDHFDQIYYAMSQVEIREKNIPKAIEYLLLSTSTSTTNAIQKGISFLKLGEIHFDSDKFVKAQQYYDSAVVFLPRDYKDIKSIVERKVILSELSKHIQTIEKEDSLQRIASLPVSERNAIVDKIIEEVRIEEERRQEEERQRRQTMMNMAQNDPRSLQGAQSGGWYFYNTSTITFGRTEFMSKWGDRKLEDNWRLSQKSPNAFDLSLEGSETDSLGAGEAPGSPLNRQTYLKNLPTTPEQLAESNTKIEKALYGKGLVFQDKLQKATYAIQSFEDLLKRFSQTEYKLNALYYLYSLNKNTNNTNLAEAYKNRIINEFPDSDFAQILIDPDYYKKIAQKASFAENLYKQSFEAFNLKQDDRVLELIKTSDSLDIDPDLKARFLFLHAITMGRKDDLNLMDKELNRIVNEYKETAVAPLALNMLEYRKRKNSAFTEIEPVRAPDDGKPEEQGAKPSPYKINPKAVHFYVMIINSSSVEMRALKANISDFNTENYSLNKLTVSNIFLDDKRQILTISNFQGKEKGLIYREAINQADFFKKFTEGDIQDFIISVENYPLFYKDKNVEQYLEFFQKNYLNN